MIENILMEHSIRHLFGIRIKHLRLASGMSQEAFADLTGFARSYMSRIERGEANPSLDALEILATSLKVDVKLLFDFSDIEQSKQLFDRNDAGASTTVKRKEPPLPKINPAPSLPRPQSANTRPLPSPTILVPFAKDGSWFGPNLRRRSSMTFMVGEKGHEVTFRDFHEALNYLRSMEKARWRRPNSKGNWGIVSAVRWDKLPD